MRTKLSYDYKGTTSSSKVCHHAVAASCLDRSSATIKQHINTLIVYALVVKHVLVSHRAHSYITINVQPSFPTTAASVQMKHLDRIVLAACGLVVVVKHAIEHVSDETNGRGTLRR